MTTDITELAQRVKTEASAIDDTQWYLAKPSEIRLLVEALEKAQRHIGELERKEEALRPVGVMSEKAYHRLENRESRFIALWPRPEIYLPRKRPEDGVIVYGCYDWHQVGG